jgi:hypothetical protein
MDIKLKNKVGDRTFNLLENLHNIISKEYYSIDYKLAIIVKL